MIDVTNYAQAAQALVDAGRFLYGRGWSPATSSNYSARIDAEHIAITVSGRHKGQLKAGDVMVVDLDGRPVQSATRASAETALHTVLYGLFTDIGAVIHTHSLAATVLSRALQDRTEIVLQDYELQKAFPGHETHESQVRLPIFENSQDIASLAEETRQFFAENMEYPGYLIRGHGLYTWGASVEDCLRHTEALEFLLACELEMMRLAR
ncbi:methylthioribulose 1-phosphate dehydratase [Hydrocarboniclastica marina]|uniref:Methylthioribulose-1-phosphate dehydratase n=1 Tax=Hydrocarboniclastica marina TaxID=2259620 RepID=A0A4P7XI66_9ALTE|nr:methylthioribulose 1-phosphate dehydratase [Hydrocarboniclastica marina]MAL98884.1 methylthioribulose-1-phosphate dehydratase [Alteromonadaceae bacterium]QCF26393.1 methylthioribulose 1-phosphate dehydratase [Hydrocarboniclastica marina]